TGKYAGSVIINPSNVTHDTPNYPRLNDIGFKTDANSSAVFSDVKVKAFASHFGENAVLFSENTGATYDIFEGLDGVTVKDSAVVVGKDVLGYADPTYGSIPMLRKEFETGKTVESAKLYVTARGIYEMYLNGQRIGEDWFNPGYTQYDATLQYNVYDVTEMIGRENTIGAMLAPGWWSEQMTYSVNSFSYWGDYQSLLANLEITYADGTVENIVTDNSWQYFGDGPITYSGSFDGEWYNAGKEAAIEGWCTSAYNDSAWRSAAVIPAENWYSNPSLEVMSDVPVRHVETIDVIDHFNQEEANTYYSQPAAGEDIYIYDMGTNMVGVPEIRLPEMPAGTQIMIRYAEILYPELAEDNPYNYGDLAGWILTENYRAAMSTDFYTCKGTPGGETIRPSFTFHGYRYIEIRGTNGPLPQDSIQGISLSSIAESTVEYETSNPLVNQLSENIMRSLYGNHVSIPTDCPQRNERMGWVGDAAVFCRTATYYADMSTMYGTWENTMRDVQNKGAGTYNNSPTLSQVPSSESNYDVTRVSAGVAWPSAGILPVWECYQQYGDLSIVEDHMDSMIKFLDGVCYSGNLANGCQYLTRGSGLAEHLALVSTDSNYCMNVITKYLLEAVAQMAEAVGRTDKADEYRSRAAGMKAEFNEKCIDPKTKKPRTITGVIQDTEAAYALAIQYGMVSEENLPEFAQNYAAVCAKGFNNVSYTISTGFYGTGKVLPALSKAGLTKEAYAMFEQTEYASWLYPVVQGATSIWERWNGYTIENGFGGNNGMNSFNHYAAGAVGEWMVNYQLGITNDEEAPGFQHFLLQPTAGGSFTYTNGSYTSVYGKIVSGWTADNGAMTSYSAVVPANTTATLYLPVEAKDVVVNTAGATYVGDDIHNGNICAKFELLSGGYDFTIENGVVTVDLAEGYVDDSIAVKSATAPESAQVNAQFDVTVVTADSVTDVRLYNANGLAIGRKGIDVVTNEDGTKTWTIIVALGTVGDNRELKVVTKDASGILTDSSVSISIDITSVPPVLVSFDIPDSAVANRTFIVKATTDWRLPRSRFTMSMARRWA
ncbi:MAG: family 78 glycoside hydrolase catalytic domain, partial [Clostridiales bacterium]|nr:family 78 glycoside hydrolase catalytic domain [Clostridiales bacterium]